ncbi:MAG: BadF/BadG/BcrA/BcrD ATPase family protein [Candidatus Nanopelagicaceae bacterium]
MSKVILGIDGGGTKTHACVVDLEGNILGTAANGGANWERSGITAVQSSLNAIIDAALESASAKREDILDSTFALAGIDWEEDLNLFTPVIKSLGLEGRCELINDSFAALFAGTSNGIGCVSIAGTGGKSAGRDGVRTVQTMGMDLGEGGGAGQLIGMTLESIARSFHGISPRTQLFTAVPRALGFEDPKDFFTAIARDRVHPDESLAPVIFDLANTGDQAAIEVVTHVAKQHARDIQGVVLQLNFPTGAIPVVRAGGLHTADCQVFNQAFETELRTLVPHAAISILNIAPVYGSLVHAATRYFGNAPESFVTQLHRAAQKVEI